MNKINLNISTKAMQKIRYWVDKSPVEISGMGKVKRLDGGSLLVTDVWLVEQENSSTETELDPAALGKLMYQTRDIEGDLSFWWHSHVDMAVFWSAIDMEAIEELASEGYVIATVFNKKGEMRTAYCQGEKDICPAVFVDEIPTSVVYNMDDPLYVELEKEFKEKCKQKVYKPSSYFTEGGGHVAKGLYDKNDSYYSTSKFFYWDKDRWKYDPSGSQVKHSEGKQLSLLQGLDEDEEENELKSQGYQEPPEDSMRYFDGDIHATNLNLRWSEDDEKWVTYSRYAILTERRHTIMDSVREEWIDAFISAKGYFPPDDDSVEAFYMLVNKVDSNKFYKPTYWGKTNAV